MIGPQLTHAELRELDKMVDADLEYAKEQKEIQETAEDDE